MPKNWQKSKSADRNSEFVAENLARHDNIVPLIILRNVGGDFHNENRIAVALGKRKKHCTVEVPQSIFDTDRVIKRASLCHYHRLCRVLGVAYCCSAGEHLIRLGGIAEGYALLNAFCLSFIALDALII